MTPIPPGFAPAAFAKGYLDLSGPYFLQRCDGHTIVGLRILDSHANYLGVAHGGVLTAFADVALSYQIHATRTPALAVATATLTTNFLGAVRSGDWLEAHCRIDRLGKRLAFASGSIRRGEDTVMTMTGSFAILESPAPVTTQG
jgi:uncharacterized protein (TIGR00369 family)